MELVKKRTGIEAKFFEICSSVVQENEFILYDMEYISASSTLRVFIMNEETKTADIDECVKVTRAMNPFFDEEAESAQPWIPNDIVLEVSSPGMFRALKSIEHFELAMNQRIQCSITGKLDESLIQEAPKSVKKGSALIGKLIKIEENNIILEIDGFNLPLTFDQLKKVNLEPEV